MAPSNTSPLKKEANPSRLLWLILIAVALILFCSAVIGFLLLRPQSGHEFTASHLETVDQLNTTKSLPSTRMKTTTPSSTTTKTSTTTSASTSKSTTSDSSTSTEASTTKQLDTTTTEQMEQSTTSSVETTTTEEEPEISQPVDTEEIVGKDQLEVVNKCSSIQATSVQCSASKDSIVSQSADAFKVLHYKWNVSILAVQPTQIQASTQIFVLTKSEGKQISLNAAQTLHGLEDGLTIVDCETGKTLCVAKTVVEPREEIVNFVLSEPIPSGHHIRLSFDKYNVGNAREVLYTLTPPRWHREAPTMLGTVFGSSSARKLLPSFDNSIHKAPMDLCVSHTSGSQIRSNSEVSFSDGKMTCFETTVPLTPQQYAFSYSERAKTIITNSTSLDGSYIPSIEIAFSLTKNFKREKHDWIYNEATKVIAVLSNWTQFSYPFSKLSLISVPITLPAHSALGIISLQDRLIEYPSYTMAHESLMRSVIGQWLGGIVSTADEDLCFQDALTTYLEWKLNEQLQFVNRSRSVEITALRPRDLTRDEDRVGRRALYPNSLKCQQRLVSVFYSLDEIYGQDTVTGMIKEVIKQRAFSTATLEDWKQAVQHSSASEDAGKMMIEWFTRRTRPVLQAKITSTNINIRQLTEQSWTVPMEIVGSSGLQLVTVLETEQQIPFRSNDYVILDPARKSTAFILYDVASYLRLVRCWEATSCPANRSALKGIFHDFGAALLANHVPAPETSELHEWRQVLKFMTAHDLADGDVSCCVVNGLKEETKPDCTWVVRDTCEKLNLIKALHI